MKYRLLKGNCILTNKLYYDKGVVNCAGIDIKEYFAKVENPIPIVKLQNRYCEDNGYFNITLEDGTPVFMVNISRLLIERKEE